VSHRLAEIAQIADRIFVMRDGHMVARHDTGQVREDDLIAEMVGRTVTSVYPTPNEPTAEPVLQVEDLTGRRFRHVSFDVHAGEVFGIAGIVGAGRTELMRAVCGVDKYATGKVKVRGKPLGKGSIRAAIDAGIVMIPEDRKSQGVIVSMTVQNNVALSSLDRLAGRVGWVVPRAVVAAAADAIARFGVKGRPQDVVRSLPGGNQQKLVISKWLAREPSIVILDEPTRGIDVGARASIYELIGELSRGGVAVVVVSSDLEEVLGLAHRVMVLTRGLTHGILSREEASPERVMALATQ
jgi:ribose transport system ATP-binding protein